MAFEDIIGTDLALGNLAIGEMDSEAALAKVLEANPAVMRELALRNASALVARKPMKSREFPLGFPETTIAAGATADIVAQPQTPFRGERLVVPSDIAGLFSIDDIRVGKNSQLVAFGPLPARAFTEVGVGVGMHLDTCQVSMQIVLRVRNISGQSATFRALLIGRAVE